MLRALLIDDDAKLANLLGNYLTQFEIELNSTTEPTLALDLIAQHELLKFLRRYTMEDHQNMSLLTISHDPVVIRYLCDSVKVLYKSSESDDAAKVVEELEGAQIWQGPYVHEHTKLLMGNLH